MAESASSSSGSDTSVAKVGIASAKISRSRVRRLAVTRYCYQCSPTTPEDLVALRLTGLHRRHATTFGPGSSGVGSPWEVVESRPCHGCGDTSHPRTSAVRRPGLHADRAAVCRE